MQTQATKLLARAQGLARTTAESPAGKAAWNVYERAAELVGVNVNEPVFGEDAERKTTSVLEEAAKQGYIVTDEAAQGKLWKQVYYTTLWQTNTTYNLAKTDFEAMKAVLSQGTNLNAKVALLHGLFFTELYAWYFFGTVWGDTGLLPF